MKLRIFLPFIVVLTVFSVDLFAQGKTRPSAAKPKAQSTKNPEIGKSAVVIDETLSVLRKTPSLYSESVHRMSRGRVVTIAGVQEADGVKFYKVVVPPKNWGWVQADAVFGKFRATDEQRFFDLIKATDGFEQIEMAAEFFTHFGESPLRPKLLLLYGDIIEATAPSLSKQAASRLKLAEMKASAAPIHSYYLNFNMLDRYRKLGITFLFDTKLRQYHYDGASWAEIVKRFPNSPEAVEAKKRIELVKQKMGIGN